MKCLYLYFPSRGTSPFGGYSDEAFVYALRECGIRHLDASKYSGIEEQLAVAIQESCVPRSELWITNKLWPLDYGYDSAMEACLASCTRMGIDYFGMCCLQVTIFSVVQPFYNNPLNVPFTLLIYLFFLN